MLFARPHAGDDFQLQEMLLHDEKFDARCEHQIHVHHVHQMCAMRCVTKDLGLQVHPVPRASLHLDACLLLQPFHQLAMDTKVQREQLLFLFRQAWCALQLGRDKSFQKTKLNDPQ